MHGGLGASGYRPCRAITSAKFSPAACTRTRTWPGPTCGSGVSRTANVSGPPVLVIQTARIQLSRASGYDLRERWVARSRGLPALIRCCRLAIARLVWPMSDAGLVPPRFVLWTVIWSRTTCFDVGRRGGRDPGDRLLVGRDGFAA